jgi:hypothetical protein
MKLARKGAWAAIALPAIIGAHSVSAQQSGHSLRAITVYVDRKTKQLFLEPKPDRDPIKILGELGASPLGDTLAPKVGETAARSLLDAVVPNRRAEAVSQPGAERNTALKSNSLCSGCFNLQSKFRLGVVAYLDWGLWTHSGYGPYFLENLNTPGVGNDGYNSFDLNRLFLNAYFTPTPDLTFRVTPELYRGLGTASPDKLGSSGAVASNLDGDLNLRIRYADIQYRVLFRVPALQDTSITLGAQPNPLVSWQEDFGQYRFVYLTPWNYLGLSSSQIGLTLAGRVKLYGGDATHADYQFGVFDNGNFNNQEQSNTKQFLGRLTIYPLGARWRYDGLGLTGFYNYGYANVAPNSNSLVTPLKGSEARFERIAALVHYAAEHWNILGELDYGQNAFSLANLYRGSGPIDAFGMPSGTPFTNGVHFGNRCSSTLPCYDALGTYGPQLGAYQAFLNNGRSRQVGFDVLGHYHIPGTRLTVFGLTQWFMPNDHVRKNPLDFQRFVLGVSYQFNEYLRIAISNQALLFYHRQFGMTVRDLMQFNYVPGSRLNGQILPGNPNNPSSLKTVIGNLVPRDTHAFFLNLEFAE